MDTVSTFKTVTLINNLKLLTTLKCAKLTILPYMYQPF